MAGSTGRFKKGVLPFAAAILVASGASADPPARVARVSFLSGAVSFRPGSVDDWTNPLLNYPVTSGDHLWVDRGGRAELQMGTTALRVSGSTELSVLTLDDRTLQLRLTEGSIAARVRSLAEDESIEIDTPNGSIDLLRPGFYRIDVNESGEDSVVVVRSGEAEATTPGAAYTVHAEEGALVHGVDGAEITPRGVAATDAFEDWCLARDRRADAVAARRYVSPGMVGYEDLDEYGTWQVVGAYGTVWVPRVHAGWVPYREGRWVWIDPWGWTWIEDAPWGFAPFHYGRWVSASGNWVWVPGTIVARPVYAPALVAFVGGVGWHASVSMNEPIAWFPLGPREPFIPVYHVSPEYVRAVNITHVTVTNVTVTNITYVNRSVPGAVTAVSRTAFVQARPIGAEARAVPRELISQAPIVGTSAPVVPERTSVAVPASIRVTAPPPNIVERKVVVRRTPSPAPVPFDMARRALQERPGVPLDEEALRTLRSQSPSTDRHPLVRAVTAAPPARSRPQSDVQAQPSRVTPAPFPTNGQLATKQARERQDLDARHAHERDAALKRHQQLEAHAGSEQDRARVRVQNEQEDKKIEERQKKEREVLDKRHEAERRNGGG